MSTILNVDVVVLGGGVAAWAAAVVLAQAGVRVGVIGRHGARSRDVGEYLPSEGISALTALELESLVSSSAHVRSAGILSRWGSAEVTRQSNLLRPGGHAICLDRAAFHNDVASRSRDAGAISFSARTRAVISRDNGIWQIAGDDSTMCAPVAIDASGRSAALSRAAGAEIQRYDDLVALSVRLDHAQMPDTMFRVESLKDGWCYIAPQEGGRCMAVFLGDACDLPKRNLERAQVARERLSSAKFAGDVSGLGNAQWSEQPVVAWTQCSVPSAGAGWAAIGDAAMAFDPLASAGLTKLFLDVRAIADLFCAGRTNFDCLLPRREAMLAQYRSELASAYTKEHRFRSHSFWRRRRITCSG